MKKLTQKQEAFCLAYIETGNASEAYRQAYNAERMKPETINKRACELMGDGYIAGRIEQLREPVRERHNITVDTLLLELEQSRQLALQEGQAAAAVSATMSKAKLLGLDKQILEHTGKDGEPFMPTSIELVAMTPEEIKRIMAEDDC